MTLDSVTVNDDRWAWKTGRRGSAAAKGVAEN